MVHLRNFRVGLVVLAVLAAVNFIVPMPRVQAQDDPIPTTIEITGLVESLVVSSVDDAEVVTGLVIDGVIFEVGTVDVAGVALGDWVTVVANLSEDDVYTLQELTPELEDIDGDTVLNDDDNCPFDANEDQLDTDEDGIGDICQAVDEDDEDADEDEDTTACDTRVDHPVATALAAEFEVDYDTVMGWHCDGFGFGEISRALMLADQAEDGAAPEEYLEMKAGGLGWGEIVKDSGVNPGDLAQGRVISQKNKDKDKDGEDEDSSDEGVQLEQTVTGPGSSGNNNGGGNNNNGNNGNNGGGNGNNGNNGSNGGDAPGNSGSAPGHNKK